MRHHRTSSPRTQQGLVTLLRAHPTYAAFWTAGTISATGSWLQTVAAALAMLRMTGSPIGAGIATASSFLPALLLSVPAGAVADRFHRPTVVVVGHLAGFALAAATAAMAWADKLTPTNLVVLTFAGGVAYTFARPATAALVPSLVPADWIRQAVAANSSQFMVAQLVGPALAGIAVQLASEATAFGLNALSFLPVVAVMPAAARVGRQRAQAAEPAAATTAEAPTSALAYLRRDASVLRLLLVVGMSNWVIEGLRTMAPVYAIVELGEPESTGGWLISGFAVGAVVSIVTLSRSLAQRPPLKATAVGFVVMAIGLLIISVSPSLWISCVAAGLVGLGNFLGAITATGVLQEVVEEDFRGRVLSFHSVAVLGIRPFAGLAITAAATVSIRGAIAGWALFSVLGLLLVGQLARGAAGWRRWLAPDGTHRDDDAPDLVTDPVIASDLARS